jgi:hypothetical protein
MSISERKDDFDHSLTSVRARHPGWQIAFEHHVYIAVERPAQTAQNIVAAPDLAALDKRLNELDGR